jgi:hypothetical protein
MQTVILHAQATEKPEPRLSLTIFLSLGGTHTPGRPDFRELKVIETNTSNELIRYTPCPQDQGVYRVSILYNGLPLEERDAAARKKREADAKNHPWNCPELAPNGIKPGQSWTRYMGLSWDYPMCKPGTYEITVSRESDLEHPEKSVTVKSNTVTVVVPESDACDP